jgi:hypothetical protein
MTGNTKPETPQTPATPKPILHERNDDEAISEVVSFKNEAKASVKADRKG